MPTYWKKRFLIKSTNNGWCISLYFHASYWYFNFLLYHIISQYSSCTRFSLHFHESTTIAIKIKPGIQTMHCMTSDILLLVFLLYFQILTDNYFKLNHLVIAGFSLLLFRFHCNLLFVTRDIKQRQAARTPYVVFVVFVVLA